LWVFAEPVTGYEVRVMAVSSLGIWHVPPNV
jgi:hypothetical protein